MKRWHDLPANALNRVAVVIAVAIIQLMVHALVGSRARGLARGGAALARAFSYVLRWWERRSLTNAITCALKELNDYAAQSLRIDPRDQIVQRLSRRRAFDALALLAAAPSTCWPCWPMRCRAAAPSRARCACR